MGEDAPGVWGGRGQKEGCGRRREDGRGSEGGRGTGGFAGCFNGRPFTQEYIATVSHSNMNEGKRGSISGL